MPCARSPWSLRTLISADGLGLWSQDAWPERGIGFAYCRPFWSCVESIPERLKVCSSGVILEPERNLAV